MKKYNRAIQKIENAYKEFKESMMSLEPETVYDFAYKIYCIEEIYGFMINGRELSKEAVGSILKYRGNILLHIYKKWGEHETNYYGEFCSFIKELLKTPVEQRCAYAA